MMDCVNSTMREGHFLATGQYATDQAVYAWFVKTVLEIAKGTK